MSKVRKVKSKNAPPPADIGGMLAKQRQNRNATVERLAKTTNLSKEIIEHLENNEFSEIGAPVYVRGYLSLYAKTLGLDVAEVIGLYNTHYPSNNVALRPAISQMNGKIRQERKRHSKTASVSVSLAVLVILLYTYFQLEPVLLHKVIGKEEVVQINDVIDGTVNLNHSDDTAATDTSIEMVSDTVIDEVENVTNLASDVLKGQPIIGNTTTLNSDETLNDIELESVLNSVVEDDDEKPTLQSLEDFPETDKPTESDVTDKAGTAMGIPPVLEMHFTADCWLRITDKRGKTVAEGIYSAKRPVSITADLPLILKTGRPSAIASVKLKGKSVRLKDYQLSQTRFEIKE